MPLNPKNYPQFLVFYHIVARLESGPASGQTVVLAEGACPHVVEIKMDKWVKMEVFKPALDTQWLSSYIRPTKGVHV